MNFAHRPPSHPKTFNFKVESEQAPILEGTKTEPTRRPPSRGGAPSIPGDGRDDLKKNFAIFRHRGGILHIVRHPILKPSTSRWKVAKRPFYKVHFWSLPGAHRVEGELGTSPATAARTRKKTLNFFATEGEFCTSSTISSSNLQP